ncbi:MAG: type III pantothenate kinase, partial [Clostridia bacterium]
STVDALSAVASKLPQVEISSPQKAIAQSTAKAIQSGVVYGAVGQTMYIVDKIKKELKDSSVKVIATGGLSYLVAEQEHIFDYVDKELSLIGLNVIYNLNK